MTSMWITRKKRLGLYLVWDLSCAYCGTGLEEGVQLNLDHLTPRMVGGTNHESNLVCSCETCNKKKGGRDWREFATAAASYSGLDPVSVIDEIEYLTSVDISPYVQVAAEMIESRGSYAKALKDAMTGEPEPVVEEVTPPVLNDDDQDHEMEVAS